MGTPVVDTPGKKKLSGTAKGYLILFGLVVLSWLIFKILTPSNFGSPANMLSYFQASLIATVGAVGFYFVMVMGMFDFSIGANIMLSAIVGCVFASRFGMGYAGLIIGSHRDRFHRWFAERCFLCKASHSVHDRNHRSCADLRVRRKLYRRRRGADPSV